MDVRDWAGAMGFALARLGGGGDPRPLLIAAPRTAFREGGWPFVQGMLAAGSRRLLLVSVEREAQVLWALEEALKSGAVAGGLAVSERISFVATRRLEFAAEAGRATAILVRPRPQMDLSAARLRWRISALPSLAGGFDPKAPGSSRLRAELVRRRDGPPGAWTVELEDETHHLRLASGLAGDGVVQDSRANAA